MDINIRGRNVGITDRFESYVLSKSEKIEGLAPKTIALEVTVSRMTDRSPKHGDRVEITLIGPGPVVRAESEGSDKYTAFDIAYGRLLERLRRAHDRKKDRRGRGRISIGEATNEPNGDFGGTDLQAASVEVLERVSTGAVAVQAEDTEPAYSPVVIRTKQFPAAFLSVEDAVDQMELVGHDFFLFVESSSGKPSVVYRRKGWDYGVISLEEAAAS